MISSRSFMVVTTSLLILLATTFSAWGQSIEKGSTSASSHKIRITILEVNLRQELGGLAPSGDPPPRSSETVGFFGYEIKINESHNGVELLVSIQNSSSGSLAVPHSAIVLLDADKNRYALKAISEKDALYRFLIGEKWGPYFAQQSLQLPSADSRVYKMLFIVPKGNKKMFLDFPNTTRLQFEIPSKPNQ